MRKRNRLASVFRFDECGHVSPLMSAGQIKGRHGFSVTVGTAVPDVTPPPRPITVHARSDQIDVLA